MKIKVVMLLCFVSNLYGDIHSRLRLTSKPYITGDTFREAANWILDDVDDAILYDNYTFLEDNRSILIERTNFDPKKVQKGDVIYVSSYSCENIERFFKYYHPKIDVPYILLTHNGDFSQFIKFKHYLDDKKLLVWFAQNVDFEHSKLVHIPIGLENKHWGRNYDGIIANIPKQLNKTILLYMNFNIANNVAERLPVYNFFKDKPFCTVEERKTNEEYLINISNSKFVISPLGNGLDCHRTWEALYLGCFPVVKTSSLDNMYKDLPVVIVNDWREVTQEFLESKYLQMKNQKYNLEKLYFKYWLELIDSYQKKCT